MKKRKSKTKTRNPHAISAKKRRTKIIVEKRPRKKKVEQDCA